MGRDTETEFMLRNAADPPTSRDVRTSRVPATECADVASEPRTSAHSRVPTTGCADVTGGGSRRRRVGAEPLRRVREDRGQGRQRAAGHRRVLAGAGRGDLQRRPGREDHQLVEPGGDLVVHVVEELAERAAEHHLADVDDVGHARQGDAERPGGLRDGGGRPGVARGERVEQGVEAGGRRQARRRGAWRPGRPAPRGSRRTRAARGRRRRRCARSRRSSRAGRGRSRRRGRSRHRCRPRRRRTRSWVSRAGRGPRRGRRGWPRWRRAAGSRSRPDRAPTTSTSRQPRFGATRSGPVTRSTRPGQGQGGAGDADAPAAQPVDHGGDERGEPVQDGVRARLRAGRRARRARPARPRRGRSRGRPGSRR